MKTINFDPAEEWLAQYWLGNLRSFLSQEEITKEIKAHLYKYIYNLLETTNQYEPPFNPELLFEDRKILKKTETQLPNNMSGLLIPTSGGFIMKVNSNEPKYRKRFNVAHEIGHTFFYDLKENIPIICFNKSKSRYWVQEGYANEIAETILLPEPSLKKELNKLLPCFGALKHLSKLYQVSHDVLRHRIVKLCIWDCIIFKSTMDSSGNIRTNKTDVSKSIYYKTWHIPHLLEKQEIEEASKDLKKTKKVLEKTKLDSFIYKSSNIPKVLRKYLCLVFAEVLKSKRFSKEEMGSKYSIQSTPIKDRNNNSYISFISLITPVTRNG